MSADSYGGSASDGGAHRDETIIDPVSREDIESSVLDALRPLLGPKRKKVIGTDETASETGQAKDGNGQDVGAKDVGAASETVDLPSVASEAPSEPVASGSDAVASEPARSETDASTTPEPAPVTDQHRNPDMTYHVKTTDAQDKALDTFVAGREIDEFETFLEIGGDLERRSRRSATMARLLDQHHAQLQTAEKERDEAYEKLARVYPVVQETARALKEAMDSRKVDPDPSRMARLFQLNGRALDELEKVAVTIFADFLWCKSAWELYAKTVGDARELRANADS